MSSRAYKVNFGYKDNSVVYDDNDPMFDNHHMSSGVTLKYVIDTIKESGADVIYTSTTNNNPKTPTLDRVKRICKACGYYYIDKSEWKESYRDGGEKWFDIKYELHRGKAPKNAVQGNALARANKSPAKKISPIKAISPTKANMPSVPPIRGVTKPLSRAINTANGMRSMPVRMLVTKYIDDSKKKRKS